MALVTYVADGDTIVVDLNGVEERVRYIGIDTPEVGDPCGDEATQANRLLVNGQMVRLEKDISERDRYGRLLRYVYVGDVFVNAELVKDGWAVAYRYEPDTSLAVYLESQQVGAPVRECAAVVESAPPVAATAVPEPTLPPAATAEPPPPQPTPEPAPAQVCEPGYDPCIPPGPDVDCAGGSGNGPRYVQGPVIVTGSDPYGLDRDNDGIGCE
jgi:micrococcal nuclease